VAQPNSDDTAQVQPGEVNATDEVQPGDEVEAVVVTGSRLRRDAANSPTPLIQLNREEILQSGEPSLVDYLADVPALQNSQVAEDTTGGFLGIGGLSLLNLRNLGTDRTLVLIDGRRHVGGEPGSAAVDVDTIPTALIENTEIITGGASAVYGADAVSGVVNFILRKNFEGLEIDAAVGQLSQGVDATSRRVSVLAGRNFLDDRLNIYGYAEYQKSDAVFDNELEIGYLQRDERLIGNDVDPASATEDGVFDNLVYGGLRSFNRPRNGVVVLANQVRPSPATDPDRPLSTAVFNTNPGFTYVFDAQGNARLASFGTFVNPTGANIVTSNSPDAEDLLVVDVNRLPEQDAYRFQTGLNFDLTESVQLFGELKYVRENNLDLFQPGFANVTIQNVAANFQPNVVAGGLTTFTIGLDNAFLPANLRSAILANQRPVFNAAGVQTSSVADPRAQVRFFTFDLGLRPSDNTRELTRFVGGLRGDRDRLGFVENFAWEIGYTYGETKAEDVQSETIDQERLSYSLDAVRDVNNVTGKGANAIVCRVQLQAAQGIRLTNPVSGRVYTANDPEIRDCVPGSVFGQGGLLAARGYLLEALTNEPTNTQQDVLAFVSGEILSNLNPAGGIGIVLGAEYREEKYSSIVEQFGDRSFFGNAGGSLEEAKFDVSELFGELTIPILRDLPLAQLLEVTGAFRRSDYSTLGEQDVYSVNGIYRPSRDVLFRASYGKSIRAPNLSELFDPPFDTFPNITDPCSRPVIDTTSDQRIRENRIKNCAALGIPATYVDPNPGFSNQGSSGSNPNLQAEESDSYTASISLTPRFAPGFSLVFDWYDIKITNAIQTIGVQTIANLCVDNETINPLFCDALTRNPAGTIVSGQDVSFEIADFIEGPFNFAALRARGMDFNARYRVELSDLDFLAPLGSNLGRLDLSLRGNYLIRRQNFTNPTNPAKSRASWTAPSTTLASASWRGPLTAAAPWR
jgi:outer membrane receptor protein involved in Fe transport